jgi:hypothetical protein
MPMQEVSSQAETRARSAALSVCPHYPVAEARPVECRASSLSAPPQSTIVTIVRPARCRMPGRRSSALALGAA